MQKKKKKKKMFSFLVFQSEDILWRMWGRGTMGVDR